MSQYPRIVLTDTKVPVDGRRVQVFVRRGTLVDIAPGSALEADYGGSSNLSPVIPASDPRRSPEGADGLSKEAQAN